MMAEMDLINRKLSGICGNNSYSSEAPRRFAGYANRLRHVLNQCARSWPPEGTAAAAAPAVMSTAIKGITVDVAKSEETLGVYRRRSRIYIRIHCKQLCAALQERAAAIGAWLALLDSGLASNPDLHQKVADLSRDMEQAQFNVSENEERVYFTLQKEAQGRQTSKAVQSAIIMDLAHALGIDCGNHAGLTEHVRLPKSDLNGLNSSDCRILISLERILDNWLVRPDLASLCLDLDPDEDAHIPLFKDFICPLTKEVMKDPVVLESSQTYERTAIQYWFDRCIEDGHDPTCPLSGQMLVTLDLKPNFGLAGAIEEWINCNIEIQIKSALQYLSGDSSPPLQIIEKMLGNMYKISEDQAGTLSGKLVLLLLSLDCSNPIQSLWVHK